MRPTLVLSVAVLVGSGCGLLQHELTWHVIDGLDGIAWFSTAPGGGPPSRVAAVDLGLEEDRFSRELRADAVADHLPDVVIALDPAQGAARPSEFEAMLADRGLAYVVAAYAPEAGASLLFRDGVPMGLEVRVTACGLVADLETASGPLRVVAAGVAGEEAAVRVLETFEAEVGPLLVVLRVDAAEEASRIRVHARNYAGEPPLGLPAAPSSTSVRSPSVVSPP